MEVLGFPAFFRRGNALAAASQESGAAAAVVVAAAVYAGQGAVVLDCMWTITPSLLCEQMQFMREREWGWRDGQTLLRGVCERRIAVLTVYCTRSKSHSPGTFAKRLMLPFFLHLFFRTRFGTHPPLLLFGVCEKAECDRHLNEHLKGGNWMVFDAFGH